MKKPRKPRPRAIPQHYPTGHAERVATAAAEFVVDIDPIDESGRWVPTAHWVIRKGQGGPIIDHAPGATRSEVYERVALLNRSRGKPTVGDERSWGKLKKSGARPTRHSVKDITKLFERLVALPRTARVLKAYAASAEVLHRTDLAELLQQVLAAAADLDLGDDDDKLMDALSQQLWLKLKIRRNGSEYQ